MEEGDCRRLTEATSQASHTLNSSSLSGSSFFNFLYRLNHSSEESRFGSHS